MIKNESFKSKLRKHTRISAISKLRLIKYMFLIMNIDVNEKFLLIKRLENHKS